MVRGNAERLLGETSRFVVFTFQKCDGIFFLFFFSLLSRHWKERKKAALLAPSPEERCAAALVRTCGSLSVLFPLIRLKRSRWDSSPAESDNKQTGMNNSEIQLKNICEAYNYPEFYDYFIMVAFNL